MDNRKIIVANWKMYKTLQEDLSFIQKLAPLVTNSSSEIYIAVPFTGIALSAKEAQGTSIKIGAQNMNDASEGAFTGEIAGSMLKDAGAEFVILGHSERRRHFQESDSFINKKVKKALEVGLKPILCIGETLDQRENNETEDVLDEQLYHSLEDITKEEILGIYLAYEPIWAIGTGVVATPDQIEKTHAFIREKLASTYGQDAANKVKILYGGSVKPDNAKDILHLKDVDGALVGGASLQVESFAAIISSI